MVRQIAPKTQLGLIKSNVNQGGETIAPEIVYPESDGKPMADNTKQFTWIVKIKENLEVLFKSNPDVFVAGDLFWYPVKGSNRIKLAPDTMVVFGRPKGQRGSYRQWEEDNIPPQVVFEILSPSNSKDEMTRKKLFYLKHGVEEYYVYDPDGISLEVSIRENNSFKEIEDFATWTSPRLNIRFDMTGDELVIYYPDGSRFLSPVELSNYAEQERFLKEQANHRAEQERLLKEQERFLKEQEQLKYQTLLSQLKAKGIDITALE
ncbi:MAG: Uma2 family endonuclease [Cylindrospermopsis raciborskii KL1]|uniref:Uma2 family endonuclease n=1 Tax=Cylindrospermopsis raciborskii TaxID=77022 RepID=UPI001A2ADB4D|nr:Uma2 family endonuclease [Cylindrospermopsis raciborskii]MBG0742875.1 Uma2 family endonuclease [Cylindrospermopsis raciborskii KL1]